MEDVISSLEDAIDRIRKLQEEYKAACSLNKDFAEDKVVVVQLEGRDDYQVKTLEPKIVLQECDRVLSRGANKQIDAIILEKIIPLIDKELLEFYQKYKEVQSLDPKDVVIDILDAMLRPTISKQCLIPHEIEFFNSGHFDVYMCDKNGFNRHRAEVRIYPTKE